MFGSDLKQLVVLDDLRDKLEMIDSDIMPETCAHPVVTGIENVPTSIRSQYGTSYEGAYTTFPLSPLQGRVHHIKDSFLNCSIDVNFQLFIGSDIEKDIVLYIGPRDTASIFNQLQLMIDNNVIWTTTYQHIESAIDMAGLPASVIDHSPNYATIDKLLTNKQTPMQKIVIPAGTYKNQGDNRYLSYSVRFEFSIDLNRLCVPLSNIAYITSNMGNLRLRCYFTNFHQAFYVFQMPDDVFGIVNPGTGANTSVTLRNAKQLSKLLSLEPVKWGSVDASGSDAILSNPQLLVKPFVDTTTVSSQITEATATKYTKLLGTRLALTDVTQAVTLVPVQFILRGPKQTEPFMAVTNAQICQTCFELKEDSYQTLCDYFKQAGNVIIPIQAWATALFNNGTIDPAQNGTVPASIFANVPGNNITSIVVTATPVNAQSCLTNPYLSNIQGILDGKPLNTIPYDKIDNRAIQDFTNACIDTDNEEINTDYLYSLQFPQFVSVGAAGGSNKLGSVNSYFYTIDGKPELSYFARQGFSQGMVALDYQKNPNLFMMVFQTAIPDSFHTGMCIIENSNRQAIFRLTNNSGGSLADMKTRFYDAKNTTVANAAGTFTVPGFSDIYQNMTNYTNVATQFNISCLCDECIVLQYDGLDNTCKAGYLNYAKPFVVE